MGLSSRITRRRPGWGSAECAKRRGGLVSPFLARTRRLHLLTGDRRIMGLRGLLAPAPHLSETIIWVGSKGEDMTDVTQPPCTCWEPGYERIDRHPVTGEDHAVLVTDCLRCGSLLIEDLTQ